jgi:D-3-phosphoglycerate dehydrogenase
VKPYYIIDFDSTFTQVEALDELAKISLQGHPDRIAILQEIANLTNLSMEGRLSFRESLTRRVHLLHANRMHLEKLVQVLKKRVSGSFKRNRAFFQANSNQVLIVSGGFKEFIVPVVEPYFIRKENVYANEFRFDTEGNIIGYDELNPLSEEAGKVKLLKQLNLEGELFGIGDGYSDFQLKESGLITQFLHLPKILNVKPFLKKPIM